MGGTLKLVNLRIDKAALAELCRRHRVRELSVLGSPVRGEMRPDSDIDLLAEFLPDAEVDLVDHAGLMLDLAQLLGRKVDLVLKKGLKPLIRVSRQNPPACRISRGSEEESIFQQGRPDRAGN